jgi:hypothetical protein
MGAAARTTMIRGFAPADAVAGVRQLYDAALVGFALRGGTAPLVADRTAWTQGTLNDLPRPLRRSLVVREDIDFMHNLLEAGAVAAARKVALRMVFADPLNIATWRAALAAFPLLRRSASSLRSVLRPARN